MKERKVVIVDALRTPFSKYGGSLKLVPSITLGSFVIKNILERNGLGAEMIEEVYYGTCEPMEIGIEINVPARQAVLKAGLPPSVVSMTIDTACCSSLDAVNLGWRSIKAGFADVVLAVGAENMGRQTYYFPPEFRWGPHRRNMTVLDAVFRGGAYPVEGASPVAVDAGNVAVEYGVTREENDLWAYNSHKRYGEARQAGKFREEVIPFKGVLNKKEEVSLDIDEQHRPDVNLESLGKLPTVYGSPLVTAGNAPGINAGASAVLLMEQDMAQKLGLKTIGEVVYVDRIAMKPSFIAVAPAIAIKKVLAKTAVSLDDMKLIEINEAFAVMPLVSTKILAEDDPEKTSKLRDITNVNGGAIAIGHPVGASGARILMTLTRELARRGGGYGIASICGGLAQAAGALVKV